MYGQPGFPSGGGMPPIYNPPVPYFGPVPGGRLTPGTALVVRGMAHHGADRWDVNMVANGQKAFHFNPRHPEGCVVRNTESYGNWGNEERHGGLPFHPGQPFELIITAEPQGYQVMVNNQQFPSYNHRTPMDQVNSIEISGDVQIQSIEWRQPVGGAGPLSFQSPPVPFRQPIMGGLAPNRQIVIRGSPRHGSEGRFNVNLCCDQYDQEVGLHFDVRMNYGSDRSVVIRNAKMGGNWQNEERHGSYFPFAVNQPFQLQILCDQYQFKVAVNGQHLFEFNYRVQPVNRINFLTIEGDVYLENVSVY